MTNRKKNRTLKYLIILSLLLWGGDVFASDWILASAPFSFTQKGEMKSSQQKVASQLPQMILEQIGSGDTRVPPRTEMLDRKLADLRTERLSLFLQLSGAIKTRDSIFLVEKNEKKLEKKISEQEKKIKEIQAKIDENLLNVEKSVGQVQKELSGEEEKETFFESVSFFFGKKRDEKLVPDSKSEAIKIYKDDSSALLNPDSEIWATGMESLDFINFIGKEKVNGYLTGSLTFYGDYFSASVELRIYPGGKSAGSVMEVGHVDNMVQVARNISQYMRTLVVNSSPVQLYFDITPEEALKNSKIKIDGIVCGLSGNTLSVSAGIHTVNIECKGYETLTTTYTFRDSAYFFVHIPMVPEQQGQFNLYLKNPAEGDLFAGGKIVGDGVQGGTITINGSPVIGQIQQKIPGVESFDDDGKPVVAPDKILGAFYYIPMKLQNDGSDLIVNVTPVNLSELIDYRRKWAYRGYSAFIITLPITFFAVGNYNTAVNGYRAGYVDYNTAKGWEIAKNSSIALTAVAGGFFIYELVRYLHTASSVLPENAKVPTDKELEKVKHSIQILEPVIVNESDGTLESENQSDETVSDDSQSGVQNLN